MAANEYPVYMVAYRKQSKGGERAWLRNVDGLHASSISNRHNIPKRESKRGDKMYPHETDRRKGVHFLLIEDILDGDDYLSHVERCTRTRTA